MAKVTFEFNLPEDKDDYEVFSKASDMSLVLWHFANILRQETKYGKDPERVKIMEEIQEAFFNVLDEYGIDPYK